MSLLVVNWMLILLIRVSLRIYVLIVKKKKNLCTYFLGTRFNIYERQKLTNWFKGTYNVYTVSHFFKFSVTKKLNWHKWSLRVSYVGDMTVTVLDKSHVSVESLIFIKNKKWISILIFFTIDKILLSRL